MNTFSAELIPLKNIDTPVYTKAMKPSEACFLKS